MKRRLYIILAVSAVAGLIGLYGLQQQRGAQASTNPIETPQQDTSNAPNTSQQAKAFNKSQFSLDSPTSPWVVVNKKRRFMFYSIRDYMPMVSNLSCLSAQITLQFG